MSLELLKIIASKDFVSNAKSVINVLKKNKNWKTDIEVFSATFNYQQMLDSDVLISQSLSKLKDKGWQDDEIRNVDTVLHELFNNSFEYGLPSKEYSSIHANIIISTPFIKISISDNGSFDLICELDSQECAIIGSPKNKGLSFIYQITPEISQSNYPPQNELTVVIRKGCKPFKQETRNDITIIKVGTTHYIDANNYSVFGKGLLNFTKQNKIIVDFGSEEDVFTHNSRQIRNVRTEIGTAADSGVNVCICGLGNSPSPIYNYFESAFHIEESVEDAIRYLNNLTTINR